MYIRSHRTISGFTRRMACEKENLMHQKFRKTRTLPRMQSIRHRSQLTKLAIEVTDPKETQRMLPATQPKLSPTWRANEERRPKVQWLQWITIFAMHQVRSIFYRWKICYFNHHLHPTGREYAHFVLEHTKGTETNASLFEFDAIYAMCDLEIKLTNLKGFDNICQVKLVSKTCCRPWSIPNYFALLSNKSSCVDIEVKKSQPKLWL